MDFAQAREVARKGRPAVGAALAALLLVPVPPPVASATDLIAAMQREYSASWYRTATFVQKTTTFADDGSAKVATWYEALAVPGRLRIDFTPVSEGNGALFADGKTFSFKDGKLVSSRPYVHPLMLLGFDVYKLPPEVVLDQLKGLQFDLTKFHAERWQGRPAYVVGADPGDLRAAQFWIDQEDLYFVRLIRPSGPNNTRIQETQFNKYRRLGGGWMAPEVVFKTDGRVTTTEEYSELRADVPLDPNLFDPASWTTVHWRR
jgi:hypothetical protein